MPHLTDGMSTHEYHQVMRARMIARQFGHRLTLFSRVDEPGAPYAAACERCGATVRATATDCQADSVSRHCPTAPQIAVAERTQLRMSRLPEPPAFGPWLRTYFPDVAAITPDPSSPTGQPFSPTPRHETTVRGHTTTVSQTTAMNQTTAATRKGETDERHHSLALAGDLGAEVAFTERLSPHRLRAARQRQAEGWDVPCEVIQAGGEMVRGCLAARHYAPDSHVYVRRSRDGERSHNPLPIERIRLDAETARILDDIAERNRLDYLARRRVALAGPR